MDREGPVDVDEDEVRWEGGWKKRDILWARCWDKRVQRVELRVVLSQQWSWLQAEDVREGRKEERNVSSNRRLLSFA